MNKKDVADIRKHFKVGSDLLVIREIYNVYIRQESDEIYHEIGEAFPLVEQEQQELFLANFKKVLSGRLGEKLFEVKFARPNTDQMEHSQRLLYEGLMTEDVEEWRENMLIIARKMVQDTQYEKDLVVTFIRGEYYKPTKREEDETEESIRDQVYTTPFILCSMNPTEQPKRSLVFDFQGKEYKSNFMTDPIINLAKPVGGFLFPCFTDNAADVNHILYAAGKANKPDFDFIENVLGGEEIMTAQEDRAVFEEVVKEVTGGRVNTKTLANVYDELQRMIEVDEDDEMDGEIPALGSDEMVRVLQKSGVADVDAEQVSMAFQRIIDDESYEMKPQHIVPKYTSKSIKIETKVANISVSPQDLRYVHQVTVRGQRCILIEVEEDAIIDGFNIVPEELVE